MQPAPSWATTLLLYVIALSAWSAVGSRLKCWHCIGDDCHLDPNLVDHAKPRQCKAGQSCMKVYYRVKAAKTNVIIESTTRTCSAGTCLERNDFVNCTNDDVENPGCMRQYCCADRDMCNGASSTIPPPTRALPLALPFLLSVASFVVRRIRDGW